MAVRADGGLGEGDAIDRTQDIIPRDTILKNNKVDSGVFKMDTFTH